MKKLKVDDSASADFRGLGIVSPEKDYRLCFFLNKELGIDLVKTININVFEPSKNKRYTVLSFVHRDPENQLEYYFSKNRQEGFFMLPQMKQVDFIFLEPADQKNTIDSLQKKISGMPPIMSCFHIPFQQLINIDAE